MSKIGIAIIVIIFVGTAVMAGFLAYNFSIVYFPLPKVSKAPILSKVIHTTTTTSMTSSLPSGAYALPYNPSNKTVFLYIVAESSSNPFNFNGTSDGNLHIYIPAGWTVIVYFTNEEGLPHNFLIIQNTTATPGTDVGQDGNILLYVGATSSNYLYNGISSGQTASGSITLNPGVYWFACGVEGHASSGMWGVIEVSSSITTPYAIVE
ncbi:sulfocyanin [Sulfolobus sp. D5]|nr:sulfocyanin [Sulfolobus sp. B5]TRM80320.1 sulfocyanin [Sulfolobus sp. D5]